MKTNANLPFGCVVKSAVDIVSTRNNQKQKLIQKHRKRKRHELLI